MPRFLLTPMLLFTLAACTGSAGASLDGRWVLVEIGTAAVTQAAPPRFAIKGQTIEGFDGCNEFSGRLDEPGRITATRRACPPDTLQLPLDFADIKAHLAAARMERDRLVVPARAGHPASVYKRIG